MDEQAQIALEREKLSLDLQKAKLDYRKFIWGSVFAAIAIATIPPSFQLATAVLEYVRKNKELDLQQVQFRNDYVNRFISTALNQDVEIRVRLAEYFASVSPPDYRAGWLAYRDRVKDTRDNLRNQIDSMESQFQGLQERSNTANGIEAKSLLRKLEWAYAELGYAAQNRSTVVNPRPEIGQASALLKAVADLPDEKAITLAKTPPIVNPDVEKVVSARLASFQGTLSGAQAKDIVKMRVVLARGKTELDAWEAALQ